MKLEEHFKDTLERAVANEPPVFDAWSGFERRARRDRGVRILGSMAAIVAVIVAAVIVVPRLGRVPSVKIPPATQPPSPSPSVDAYEGWKTFQRGADRYTLRYPDDWRVTRYKNGYEILAPGQPGIAAGRPIMAVVLSLIDGEYDRSDANPPEWIHRGTWPDGRPYVWRDGALQNGGRKILYRIDWSTCVAGVTPPRCIRTPQALTVTIEADTGELWDAYGALAQKIAASIVYDGPVGPFVISDSGMPLPQAS